jgi:hypothetical protein
MKYLLVSGAYTGSSKRGRGDRPYRFDRIVASILELVWVSTIEIDRIPDIQGVRLWTNPKYKASFDDDTALLTLVLVDATLCSGRDPGPEKLDLAIQIRAEKLLFKGLPWQNEAFSLVFSNDCRVLKGLSGKGVGLGARIG